MYPEENLIILIVVMVVIINLDMVLLDLATDTHLATLDMDNQVMVILVNAKIRFQNIDNFLHKKYKKMSFYHTILLTTIHVSGVSNKHIDSIIENFFLNQHEHRD